MEVVERCKNCTWWDYYDDVNWAKCNLTETEDGRPLLPQTRAVAKDSEQYAAYLLTAPDFGCIQFEPKAVQP